MKHNALGWWIEEAGSPEPAPPLAEDLTADFVIVGGGYLGMWTAWHLRALAPDARIVLLEAAICGTGPSGRNGGFINPYQEKIGELAESFGAEPARRLVDATYDAMLGIETWLEQNEVDAWFRRVEQIELASSPDQVGSWNENLRACLAAGDGHRYKDLSAAEVAQRVSSDQFHGGASSIAATVQPARLAFGLRRRLLAEGVQIFEHTPALSYKFSGPARVTTAAGNVVTAKRLILAIGYRSGGIGPFRRLLSTGSSHIALTAPAPEALAQVGWTDHEALRDCRTLLHYFRTTEDGRIAFGWGGGRMGFGARPRARLEVDPDLISRATKSLRRFFPEFSSVPIEYAWGGPMDISPNRLPQFRTHGDMMAGFGFTGNGVGPSFMGGQILSRLALDIRDETSSLPLVDMELKKFPPEPLRFVGGSLVRAALVKLDEDADFGAQSSWPVRSLASTPRKMGLSLPR